MLEQLARQCIVPGIDFGEQIRRLFDPDDGVIAEGDCRTAIAENFSFVKPAVIRVQDSTAHLKQVKVERRLGFRFRLRHGQIPIERPTNAGIIVATATLRHWTRHRERKLAVAAGLEPATTGLTTPRLSRDIRGYLLSPACLPRSGPVRTCPKASALDTR